MRDFIFVAPHGKKKLIMPHDINQKEIKDIILDSLESKSDIISYEIQNIKKWIDSNALGYHIFNMLNANEYSLSNTI